MSREKVAPNQPPTVRQGTTVESQQPGREPAEVEAAVQRGPADPGPTCDLGHRPGRRPQPSPNPSWDAGL